MRRLQTGTLAILFYATFTPPLTVTLAELPSFRIELPGDVLTAERQFASAPSAPRSSSCRDFLRVRVADRSDPAVSRGWSV